MIRPIVALLAAASVAACATDTRLAPDTGSERVQLAPVTTAVALDERDPAALADLIRDDTMQGVRASYRLVAPVGLANPARAMLDRAAAEGLAPVTLGLPAGPRLQVEVTILQARVPGCPDWTRRSDEDFSNRPSSNFGCADAVNLANQVANASDLVAGRGSTATRAGALAAAVGRVATDRVKPLKAADTPAQGGPISNEPRQ